MYHMSHVDDQADQSLKNELQGLRASQNSRPATREIVGGFVYRHAIFVGRCCRNRPGPLLMREPRSRVCRIRTIFRQTPCWSSAAFLFTFDSTSYLRSVHRSK